MKKIIVIALIVGIIAMIRLNVFCINDRIARFFIMHSTVLSKNIVEYDVISIGGDAYSVGIDTMGTATPTDDVVVWTIRH